MQFNPAQLSTIEEARQLVADLAPFHIGYGVAPEVDENDYHNKVSGIYLEPWETADPEINPEPRDGDKRLFLLRYNKAPNGFQAAGFNVGLLRDMTAVNGHPLTYVAQQHRIEVERQNVESEHAS